MKAALAGHVVAEFGDLDDDYMQPAVAGDEPLDAEKMTGLRVRRPRHHLLAHAPLPLATTWRKRLRASAAPNGTFARPVRLGEPLRGARKRRHKHKGSVMSATRFSRPLDVLVGLGFPHRVASPRAALAYLDQVPPLFRDEVYHATRDACVDALSGRCTADEASDVFAAFLRRRGDLLEEQHVSACERVEERVVEA